MRKSFPSFFSAFSIALTDFSRATSKCITIFGKATSPLIATVYKIFGFSEFLSLFIICSILSPHFRKVRFITDEPGIYFIPVECLYYTILLKKMQVPIICVNPSLFPKQSGNRQNAIKMMVLFVKT